MSSPTTAVPDWDPEQDEVIFDDPAIWQLVEAGPGTGKTAVACQRVAILVDDGIPPPSILLVSFTRTAVAELRDRIISYAVDRHLARGVRISTIDSHAWSLRVGFDDEPLPKTLGDGSYDLSIARVVELFRDRHPDLLDFMRRLEHVVIDEAQDVMGVRADLIIEMLSALADGCGVTILADPAQAIYGFTTDGDEDSSSDSSTLLSRLRSESPRDLTLKKLEGIHRIRDDQLVRVFRRTRAQIEEADDPVGHVNRVLAVIRETCFKDVGPISYESIAELLGRLNDDSMLVLFRRRADVLFASSFCSNTGLQHRLRMSGAPMVVRPWVGWLFGETERPIVSRADFEKLWDRREAIAPSLFEGESKDSAWTTLHRVAAGRRPETVDLEQLRRTVSRARPPVELCLPDLGTTGPILGTIHASKGREAETVLLVMPPSFGHYGDEDEPAIVFEEGRVYYVGATRARRMLIAADNSSTPVGYLESRRIYRRLRGNRVQLEIGRDGDVDRIAHLCWTNAPEVQLELASCAGRTHLLQAQAAPEQGYAYRLVLERRTPEGVTRCVQVGQLSESFGQELGKVWSLVDYDRSLKPAPSIRSLYLVGVTTVGLTDDEIGAVAPPYITSGLALAPVVKGFPTIPFFYRKGKGRMR